MKNIRGISDLLILESFAIALNSLAKPVRYYTKSSKHDVYNKEIKRVVC